MTTMNHDHDHDHGAHEPFTFGVPLISRQSCRDWRRVDALLDLTLRSVLAQTDGDYRLLLAGHERPPCWDALTRGDQRFRFLRADWTPARPSAANDDAGCKKWLIEQAVRDAGGGLLMYLDADDLVARELVRTARRLIDARKVGGIIDEGFAIDFGTLRAMPLPDDRLFEGGFHRLCGSSTIARIEPGSTDPVRHDPHERLGSHSVWAETAAEANAELVRLPVPGGYLVNTGESHSEIHGPYAQWRREFNRTIQVEGEPVGPELAARFGLDLRLLHERAGTQATCEAQGSSVEPRVAGPCPGCTPSSSIPSGSGRRTR